MSNCMGVSWGDIYRQLNAVNNQLMYIVYNLADIHVYYIV